MRRLRLKFAEFLVVALASLAATASPAPASAEAWPAYVYDGQTYVRTRVFVTYGEAGSTIKMTGDCPKKGVIGKGTDFGEVISRLAKANRTLTVGFTVTPPTLKTVELTPVEISIQDKLIGPSKCDIRMEQMEYVSPLFDSSLYANGGIRVAPTARVRAKPTQDLVKASADVAGVVGQLVGAPANVAKGFEGLVTNTLEGVGDNSLATLGAMLAVNPTDGSATHKIWEADTGLSEEKKTLRIEARLENVASIFAPDKAALTSGLFKDRTADSIIGAPFLGDFQGGQLRYVSDLVQFATKTTNDLQTFTAATTAKDADKPCENIYKQLGVVGLSQTDRSLIVWALARSHPNLGGNDNPSSNIEQISCIKLREVTLNAVGVTLLVNKPPPALQNPTKNQMRQAVELDDTYAYFFEVADGLDWLGRAQSLFVDKPEVRDPAKKVFKATLPGTLTPASFRYYANQGTAPLLPKVGCYAYFPSSLATPESRSFFWAIGQTAGGEEVAIKATFGPDQTDVFRISALEFQTELDEAERIQVQTARGSEACGPKKDWRPTILFGR